MIYVYSHQARPALKAYIYPKTKSVIIITKNKKHGQISRYGKYSWDMVTPSIIINIKRLDVAGVQLKGVRDSIRISPNLKKPRKFGTTTETEISLVGQTLRR